MREEHSVPSTTTSGMTSDIFLCLHAVTILYHIAGYYRGTKFSRIAQTKHFEDFSFEDRGSNNHTPTVERFQYRM